MVRFGILKPLPRLIIRPGMEGAEVVVLEARIEELDFSLVACLLVLLLTEESNLGFLATTILSFLFSFCERFTLEVNSGEVLLADFVVDVFPALLLVDFTLLISVFESSAVTTAADLTTFLGLLEPGFGPRFF